MSMGSSVGFHLYCSRGRKASVEMEREHWIRMVRGAGGYR